MSPIRLIILIGAAIAAIAAAFLVRNLAQQGPSAPAQPTTVIEHMEITEIKVLVAQRDLSIGDYVSVDDLKWANWPENSIVPGFHTDEDSPDAIELVAGSVVRVPIFQNEPIHPRKLVKKGDTGTMAALIEPGMRAISVEISTESASGGFILPNDRVDVILTYEVTVQTGDAMVDKTATSTILQNVRVLAIDQVYLTEEGDGAAQVGNTATLEVDSKEAELIAMAQRKGELMLALRPWSDVGDTFDRDARIDLLENGGSNNGGIQVYRSGKQSTAGVGGS
ncbi:Flp pilus assembly protein CpaB [Hyphomonas sp.]|jgi:pilus assembly protein CpaB|uniref:Flp pilus assembly protein CpaB n=1 Tax=Hyphomonas sp. TaxID=87 RepID=UPI0025BEC0CC|nr:Flp pilus assembly protein CpaB [Hyphomonas sp.]